MVKDPLMKIESSSSKLLKRFHLSIEQVHIKISKLEEKIASLNGPENKRKRLNCFQQLAKLNKALTDPEKYTVDPSVTMERQTKDNLRRTAKKLMKKRELLKTLKKEKSRARRENCLFCKKCKIKRWPFH